MTALGSEVEDEPPRRVADLETAKADLRVLLAVLRDGRTQWYVPLIMLVVVVWGLSPVDPVSDLIPILGIGDDYIAFLIGRAAVYRFVPDRYIRDHAQSVSESKRFRFTGKHVVGGLILLQIIFIAAFGAVLFEFGGDLIL